MQCKFRKSVKRVASAGVNAEEVLKRLGFETRRRKCLALDQGPTGKERLTEVAPSLVAA